MELSQRRARLLSRLANARARAKEEAVLVEGTRAVGEALEASVEVSFAVVSPRIERSDRGPALLDRLDLNRVDVIRVSDATMGDLAATEQPQGVLAVVKEPRVVLRDVLRTSVRLLVLDAVQDPGNVGTLVRSAVAFGLDGVVALDGTADPWGAKAVRASTGTVFRTSIVRAPAAELVALAADESLPILVAASSGPPSAGRRSDGFALVLGNEGAGVRPELCDVATEVVAVGMRGGVESLNVGIAGSILMHELTRDG